MARTTQTHQTGAVGVSEIQAKFERIGWGPVRNESHDIGTDLLVAARDERRFERGIVGVQAKGGSSWFEREVRNENDVVTGWWFYEPDAQHFDDWVQHALPHLVVIHDLDADATYWTHVTPDAVKRVGKGCQVFVPITQTVDIAHLPDLLEIATSTRDRLHLEGTAFDARAWSVAPGQRLRFALLAPRLIAPHRNRGFDTAIEAEEAMALLSLGRLRDLKLFAQHHDSVPDPESVNKLRDWRWSLVRAVWQLLTTDELSGLRSAVADAKDPAGAAAATSLLLHGLRRTELYGEAVTATGALLDADELGPVDHAWMAAHRARLRLDLGHLEEAVEDATNVVRSLRGEVDDPTASALNASAAWTLFRSEASGHDLARVLTSGDTAIAWWRSQLVASALSLASARSFRTWAEDQTAHHSMEDFEAANLFAAELNADLAADHGSWRAHCALRSKQLAQGTTTPDDLAEALDGLRRSGETESFELAAGHLRADGPVTALSDAVGRVVDAPWTYTTFRSNLAALKVAGDLLPCDQATVMGLLCLRLVRGQEPQLVARLQPTFMVDLYSLRAVPALLSASGPELHDAFADYIQSEEWAQEGRDILLGPLDEAIGRMDLPFLSDANSDRLRALSTVSLTRTGAALLGLFSRAGDEEASKELRRRLKSGDRFALVAHGDVTLLDEEEAAAQIERASQAVEQQTANAARGLNMTGPWNELHELTLFNLWFPNIARWDPVVDALGEPSLISSAKRDPAKLLVELSGKIPDDVAPQIAATRAALTSAEDSSDGLSGDLGGLGVILPAVAARLAEDELVGAVAPLCFGSRQERTDLADFLGTRDVPSLRAALGGLLADTDGRVRASAAHSIGRLLTSQDHDHLTLVLAEAAVRDEGTRVPLSFIAGISRSDVALSPEATALLDRLTAHPASQVAQAARRMATSKE